ncbi:unnamed protein product [Darwinula stevensoni]|uniref:Uncharacterized protein n=1 Tax=Darwinula stevensoni TaxID=69355 RepID=A0A7R9FR93_9CRUS|nr:unnamed protein product [Darwinula stevensoni]CAG0901230.1 unnamed protein product [Darwinula stevensoni]
MRSGAVFLSQAARNRPAGHPLDIRCGCPGDTLDIRMICVAFEKTFLTTSKDRKDDATKPTDDDKEIHFLPSVRPRRRATTTRSGFSEKQRPAEFATMKTLGVATLLVLGTLTAARVMQVEDPNDEFLRLKREGENVVDAGGAQVSRALGPPQREETESTCRPPFECVPFYLCETMKTLGVATLLVPLVLGTLTAARVMRQVEDPKDEFLRLKREGENVERCRSPWGSSIECSVASPETGKAPAGRLSNACPSTSAR